MLLKRPTFTKWIAAMLALAAALCLAVSATSAQASTHTFSGDAYDNEMGIIAVLIGAKAPDRPDQLTAPLGSTKGSFIDASMVYGSDG
jgi:hypothetical protein